MENYNSSSFLGAGPDGFLGEGPSQNVYERETRSLLYQPVSRKQKSWFYHNVKIPWKLWCYRVQLLFGLIIQSIICSITIYLFDPMEHILPFVSLARGIRDVFGDFDGPIVYPIIPFLFPFGLLLLWNGIYREAPYREATFYFCLIFSWINPLPWIVLLSGSELITPFYWIKLSVWSWTLTLVILFLYTIFGKILSYKYSPQIAFSSTTLFSIICTLLFCWGEQDREFEAPQTIETVFAIFVALFVTWLMQYVTYFLVCEYERDLLDADSLMQKIISDQLMAEGFGLLEVDNDNEDIINYGEEVQEVPVFPGGILGALLEVWMTLYGIRFLCYPRLHITKWLKRRKKKIKPPIISIEMTKPRKE